MANPTGQNSFLADEHGNGLISSQQSLVADAGAITAYTAHASGSTPVTSNAATDLDTTAAALHTLQTEVTALRTMVLALADVVEAHGLMADA